jgi:undecaprenyl-diphosphatase
VFVADPRRTLRLGVALVLLVLAAALLVPGGPSGIDSRWLEWMDSTRTDALTFLARGFDHLGRGIVRVVVPLAVGVVLVIARRWAGLIAFAITESLTPLLVNAIKGAVDRQRPAGALLTAYGSSFPSGHAAYAAATVVALVLLFTRADERRAVWLFAALAAVGMGWSRTYLGVHWLSDVLAGSALGIGVALACFGATQLIAAWRER